MKAQEVVVIPPNEAPELKLQGSSSLNYTTVFNEDDSAVLLSNGLSLTDPNQAPLVSVVISLQNRLDGSDETLTVDASDTGLTIVSSGDVLTISGNEFPDVYQKVLRTVKYINNSQSPNPTDREIHWVANDGVTTSATVVTTVNIVPVNDAPLLDNSETMTLSNINENDTGSAGNTVASIINSAGGNRITDVDNDAVEGIAVIGRDNTNGSWEYKINGGSWTAFGALTNTSATLLEADALIRFVPTG